MIGLKWLIVLGILAPFIFFSIPRKPWKSGATLWFQESLYSVVRGWLLVERGVAKFWEDYLALHKAAQENRLLKAQILQLQVRTLDYSHQRQEISRLRKLLEFGKSFPHKTILAEVHTFLGPEPFRALRVERGRRDGIKVGMPVIAAQGVVGRIIRTGHRFSDVHLINDKNFYLDVLVERTRVRGWLSGEKPGLCQLHLSQRSDIKIGDNLVSSGILGSLPKGLPVGRIVKISDETDRVVQKISVEPWVDLDSLTEVIILNCQDKLAELIEDGDHL